MTADRYGLRQTLSGTSVAAPHAAGALALLLGSAPGLTPDRQWSALTRTAVDLGATGPDEVYGYGRVDALAARAWVRDAPDPTGPTTSDLVVSPEVSAGASPVVLRAGASDVLTGGSDVVAAEYFVDTAGADGTGTAIATAPAPTASLVAGCRRRCCPPWRRGCTPSGCTPGTPPAAGERS